jgi:tryptophanyl-tRNA synthetase
MSEPVLKRVLSGVQPTGNLHLGNYLGAIQRFVALQDAHACLYCVVDLHAITVPQDPVQLKHNTREVAAAFLAAGIDPKKSILFHQSGVSGHAELAWILNCTARIGWLNRMTQFKEKAGKDRENASVGLYAYPVLMAADILLYRADKVPVGEDQKQHLELARDIALKFHHDFNTDIFPLPEPLITGAATRVMSLRDGLKKMSKSDSSDASRIVLTDSADTIAQKIRKAKTDPLPLPATEDGLKERPEAANLVRIFAALSHRSVADILQEYGADGVHAGDFARFKAALIDVAVETLAPVTTAMQAYMNDPAEIDRLLKEGAERARPLAEDTLKRVREAVGFL